MSSTIQPAGACPKCGCDAVGCRFNFFNRGDLQVHSWEHKCANCGWRETQAFRSDSPPAAGVQIDLCPWCGRRGL